MVENLEMMLKKKGILRDCWFEIKINNSKVILNKRYGQFSNP